MIDLRIGGSRSLAWVWKDGIDAGDSGWLDVLLGLAILGKLVFIFGSAGCRIT